MGLKNKQLPGPALGLHSYGVLRVIYDDGKQVTLKGGDIFYMPPGHKAVVFEDLKIMDFSPQEGMLELIDHIDKKLVGSIVFNRIQYI